MRLFALLLIGLTGISATAQAAECSRVTPVVDYGSDSQFLSPEVAFKVEAVGTAADRIEVIFQVHSGYYLYREKLKFCIPGEQPAALGTPNLPAGDMKEDEYFGKQEVYHHDIVAKLPISRGSKEVFTLPVRVTYQGCAEAGLCYAPITKEFAVELPAADQVAALTAGSGDSGGYVSEQDWLAGKIRDGNLLTMIGLFFLAGLGLAFTPCVLPMVPIVAGIIAGQGHKVTRAKGFSLALAYVLGMAVTYTAAGMGFAAAGQQAQTLFQQWWIIALFAALFVAMSLSMFGLFTVQMPSGVQTLLSEISNRQRTGSYAGVAVMGALSALIVTTCVGPALVAALSVIGQSGEVARGGLALFSMAIGMGTPLLLVGASAGQLLPRAGAWMDTVKQVFGALMLAVAAWMVSRIVPERFAMLLWMVPLLSLTIVLRRSTLKSTTGRIAVRGLAEAAMIYAVLLGVGFYQGSTNPLVPLQRATAAAHIELPFERIKSLEDLNARVTEASAAGKSVMLDFYADWCVSCKEMEKYTFPTPEVQAALGNTVWLQADVTANDETDQALLKHFGIFGPPTIAFYGVDGAERGQYRVVGYMKSEEFAPLAKRALE